MLVRWFAFVCMPERTCHRIPFEQLVMPYFDSLYNFACWLTPRPHEAEDLVQETYARALKGFLVPTGHEFSRLDLQDPANTSLTSVPGEGDRYCAARS